MARGAIATAALGAATALLVACGAPGSAGPPALPRTRSNPAGPPADVTFHASVAALSEDWLTVDYEIVNEGDRPIVAFNRVPSRDSPTAEPGEPDDFYVEGAGPTLSKRVFDAPDVEMAARAVLRATIVDPGERISEHITIGRTLRSRRPYQNLLGEPPVPVRVGPGATVCIGVAPAGDVTPLSEGAHPVYAHDEQTARRQHLLCDR